MAFEGEIRSIGGRCRVVQVGFRVLGKCNSLSSRAGCANPEDLDPHGHQKPLLFSFALLGCPVLVWVGLGSLVNPFNFKQKGAPFLNPRLPVQPGFRAA